MSSRRGMQPLDELAQNRPRIVWPRACLGMELRRARAEVAEGEALDGAVVERDVRRLPRLRRLDGEAMVLARHQDAAGRALEHGVVRAAVAERQLERLQIGREREQLVPEPDPGPRNAADQAP